MASRKVSDAFITKAFKAIKTISGTARRVGISYVWAARRLQRLGLVNTKTGRSQKDFGSDVPKTLQ